LIFEQSPAIKINWVFRLGFGFFTQPNTQTLKTQKTQNLTQQLDFFKEFSEKKISFFTIFVIKFVVIRVKTVCVKTVFTILQAQNNKLTEPVR
jgi:hypothetical protein